MKIFQQQFLRSQRAARGLLQALLGVCFVGVFLFPFTAHLLGLFFVYSVVLLRLWKDCLQKKFIRLRFFINVIQGNFSHCYLKTNTKSGSFLQISEAMSMATENREGAKERRAGQHPGI